MARPTKGKNPPIRLEPRRKKAQGNPTKNGRIFGNKGIIRSVKSA